MHKLTLWFQPSRQGLGPGLILLRGLFGDSNASQVSEDESTSLQDITVTASSSLLFLCQPCTSFDGFLCYWNSQLLTQVAERESTFLATPRPLKAFLAIVTRPVVKSLNEENVETQSPVFEYKALFLQTLPSWTENALKQKQKQPTAYTKHAQMFPLVTIP